MELLKKYYSTALYLIGGLLSLIIIINIGKMTAAESKEIENALSDSTAALGVSFVMPLLWISGILTIGFSIFKIVQNKAMLIRFGIGLALLGIIWLIAYSGSTDDVNSINTKIAYTGKELKFVGGMVTTLIILIAISVAATIFAEVKKILN